jgi:hypothetical protein
MRFVPHTVGLRVTLVGGLWIGLTALLPPALGQTNLDADILPIENRHKLAPLTNALPVVLLALAAVLLIIAATLTILRHRVKTNLYKKVSDAQWNEDAQQEAGQRVDGDQVLGLCETLEAAPEDGGPPGQAAPPRQARLLTPASGPAWSEAMLTAFLRTCVKANCLGRTWSESAAGRMQLSNLPDPREAELIRRLIQRWQEFHVDPEAGVFLDHSSSDGKSRLCIISVTKDKRTISEAAFNAGFVIQNIGRYLKKTDLAQRRSPDQYHAPTKAELTAMTPGERESLVPITDIPDPWQVMIGG